MTNVISTRDKNIQPDINKAKNNRRTYVDASAETEDNKAGVDMAPEVTLIELFGLLSVAPLVLIVNP